MFIYRAKSSSEGAVLLELREREIDRIAGTVELI